MQTGILFDIQRCSLNDGPGLRTTLFLKGCPLRCLWCHNPESQSPVPELLFNFEKCIACGKCAAVCHCHSFSNGKHSIQRAQCHSCGKCVEACPTGSLEIKGNYYTVDEVLHEILKDFKYYQKSGGGVTVSGGEPFQQPVFLKEILIECHKHGIHTAIETSGFTSQNILAEILPLTDLFLWDYKVTDNAKSAIGVDNNIIMENLHFVLQQRARVRLRCPIIPTVGDNQRHLSAIAALSKRYQLDGVDILPYHNMGVFKSRELGRKPWDAEFRNMSDEAKQWISSVLMAEGCLNFQIL